jgi:hypothetical protein
MKYRGVEIVRADYVSGIDIGKRENSPVKNIITKAFTPIGVGYPMTLNECHESIDRLIKEVCRCVGVPEPEAVKLLNAN